MNTRLFSLSAGCLFVVIAITICDGAPAPRPSPPKELATLHTDGVSSIAFSPDGKMLASACYDKTIKLWDVAKEKEIAALSGHTAAVTALAFSPDGKFLISNSADNSLRLWDVPNRKSIAILDERWGRTQNLIFSPDSKKAIGGGNHIDFWDLQTKERNKQIKLPFDSSQYLFPEPTLGYNADGKLLTAFWPRHSRTVEVWDVAAGKCWRTLEFPREGAFRSCVAFSSDYKVLASAWWDICLWDISSGKIIGNYEFTRPAKRPQGRIVCLAFSPDGKLLATAWQRRSARPPGIEGVISILDPATGKELATLEGHTQDIACVVFSPDGKILASASADRTIKLWDVRGVKAPKKKD